MHSHAVLQGLDRVLQLGLAVLQRLLSSCSFLNLRAHQKLSLRNPHSSIVQLDMQVNVESNKEREKGYSSNAVAFSKNCWFSFCSTINTLVPDASTIRGTRVQTSSFAISSSFSRFSSSSASSTPQNLPVSHKHAKHPTMQWVTVPCACFVDSSSLSSKFDRSASDELVMAPAVAASASTNGNSQELSPSRALVFDKSERDIEPLSDPKYMFFFDCSNSAVSSETRDSSSSHRF